MNAFKSGKSRLRIALKAYDAGLLNSSCQQILQATKNLDSTRVIGPIPLPTRRRIYCVLRSPHVNKDSREHFEIRTHKRLIDLYEPSQDVLQTLRNLSLPAGVDVEVKNM